MATKHSKSATFDQYEANVQKATCRALGFRKGIQTHTEHDHIIVASKVALDTAQRRAIVAELTKLLLPNYRQNTLSREKDIEEPGEFCYITCMTYHGPKEAMVLALNAAVNADLTDDQFHAWVEAGGLYGLTSKFNKAVREYLGDELYTAARNVGNIVPVLRAKLGLKPIAYTPEGIRVAKLVIRKPATFIRK